MSILVYTYMQQSIEGLGVIDKAPLNQQREVLFQLARDFAQMQGWDGDKLLSQLGDYEFWNTQYLDESRQEHGMHIMDAFRCLVDVNRTSLMLGGINQTVEALKQSGKQDIVAIDAGTGTGILAMGLVASGCTRVYALEINQDSAEAAKKFIDINGLSQQITVIQCDATDIHIPQLEERGANLLVSENLSNGLFDEPQYEIIHHLSQYLQERAPVIPYASEVYVSLGWSSWDNVKKEKSNITARKLPDLVRLSGMFQYAKVVSQKGMSVPTIEGQAIVYPHQNSHPANTLLISSRFQIDNTESPIFINPDDAEFLGKTSAFRMPVGLDVDEDGPIEVSLSYPTGMPKDFSVLSVENNTISLTGPRG